MHWNATLQGIYVTADGAVYSYDYFAGSPDPDVPVPHFQATAPPGPTTESQLAARYGASPQQIGTIAEDVLAARFAEVGNAQAGVLLQNVHCYDSDAVSYIAWLYDTTTSTYSPVVLGADGDVAFRNTATAAAGLVDWLVTLYGQTRICQFENVDTTRVASCGDCPAEDACVVDCTGIYNCQRYWFGVTCPSGSDPLSCDCVGAQVCAAGSSWCGGSPGTGLTCAAP
jgi:hypothetical protein